MKGGAEAASGHRKSARSRYLAGTDMTLRSAALRTAWKSPPMSSTSTPAPPAVLAGLGDGSVDCVERRHGPYGISRGSGVQDLETREVFGTAFDGNLGHRRPLEVSLAASMVRKRSTGLGDGDFIPRR